MDRLSQIVIKGCLVLFLGFMVLTPKLSAQDVTVSGNVYDSETNDVLAGVNILVKGTNIGTSSDASGNFIENVPSSSDTLIFSYIGYETREVPLNGRTEISVGLQPQVLSEDEMVVVGYAEQKQEHLTGAVETIDMNEVNELPVGDLATAIQGRLPGVNFSGGSARPGSKPIMTIRNPMSMSKDGGNNQPLYVIDGILQIDSQGRNDNSLFNSLDPSEVESVSILKDAAAAVYGSRAANGVVVIETKQGHEGAPRFTYSGSYGISDEQERTKMLNAAEFARYINIMNGPNGANQERGVSGSDNYFFSDDEISHFGTIDYDWLDKAWSASTTQRHSLNVSGGSQRATYFGGVSYYKQTGNLSEVNYDKWTFRAGSNITVASGLRANLQVSGNYSNQSTTFNKVAGEDQEDDYNNLLRAPRYIPTHIQGLPVQLPGNDRLAGYHYFAIRNMNNYAKDKGQNIAVNVSAEYEVPFIDGLRLKGSYGRSMGSGRGSQLGQVYSVYDFAQSGENGHIYDENAEMIGSEEVSNGNRIFYSNSNNLSEQYNFTGTYEKTLGRHNFSALATIERAESESSRERVRKEEVAPGSNGHFNTAFGNIDGYTFGYESGSLSYVGRVNYQYNERYLAEFLYRTDASTKFAPENYWGHFYSISGGWIISNESFFNSDVIDFLKIRYSHGKLGKDDTRPWQWRQRFTFQKGQGAVFGGNNRTSDGMKMEVSPNRDATWSDDYKNNLGIDARFLDDRLSVSINAFYNKGRNMLLERTGAVPFSIGGSVAAENYGEANFWGGDISVGWEGAVGNDISYGIDLQTGWSTNKVLVGDFDENSVLPWRAGPGQSSDVGTWGYDYLGMFKNQSDIDEYVSKYNIEQVFGVTADNLKPGMLYYRDVRGEHLGDGEFAGPDGIIDRNDQVQLESPNSSVGIGTTVKFAYKNLSFNANMGISWGGFDDIDARDARLESDIRQNFQSVPKIWNDVYDPELNPDGTMPNPYYDNIYNRPSDFWRVSSFRFGVRNFNLSYSMPTETAEKLNLSSLKVNLTGLNPINFVNPYSYKGASGSWENYPTLRTFSLGITLRP
ncbi:SusC/RagA family TonB-linked outer membrane protein [Fodinibius salsisoli]|uniref:SusC/RagA family TonB-linked outer membrane protein n=1 Tax=Fodinibius salsisoli TaxID=2820877 RepID=A0ABT3PH94_9BACT|nr:SusC/RagA family TonB-linked outer membrane protein [Fodinibius salsisoli]MCW9705285.1 SusC/RagA family TonB-linked outer membrane protein [Fodinibius salsisoli]